MKTKNKRNYLREDGITLIALVVTIVVLLILAGVSINALFGNNGIIEKREFSILISNYRDDYEKLKNRIKTLENSRDNNNSLKQFDSSLYKKIDNLSIDLVDTFISKILIGKYNNNSRNLKIIWNF